MTFSIQWVSPILYNQMNNVNINQRNEENQQYFLENKGPEQEENMKQKEYSETKRECNCLVCKTLTRSQPSAIKTTKLCVLIMKVLQEREPEKEFFTLKTDVNEFISSHWSLLSKLRQFQQKNWRKCILDAFNHCTVIESGKDKFETRGIYRLKQNSFYKITKKEEKKESSNGIEKKQQEDYSKLLARKDYEFEKINHLMNIGDELQVIFSTLTDQLKHTQNILNHSHLKKHLLPLTIKHINTFSTFQSFL